jgi:bla regulator protein blaR1
MNTLSTTWSSAAPALGNHLWQSTLFAAIAALLALTLRNYQARTRYWLWLAASAKFLIPFSLLLSIGSHLAWSIHPATSQPAMYAAIDQISQPFTDTVLPNTPIVHTAHPSALLPAALATVWLCGFIAVLAFWSIQLRRVAKSVREAKPLQSGREIEILRRLEQTATLRSPIQLLSSPHSMEPGVFGILHPVLLWPEGISQHLDDAHLEAVLAHEVCHVQRHDNLTSTIHMLVEALFWFHPLVWWLETRLINERERACDEAVLQLGKQPQVYAESILKVCEFCVESPLTCVSGITGADLKKRIVQIMTDPCIRKLDRSKKLMLGTVGLTTICVPIVFGQIIAQNRAEPDWQRAAGGTMEFEVASIRISKPGTFTPPNFPLSNDDSYAPTGGVFTADFPLEVYLEFAYKFRPSADQQKAMFANLPKWVTTDHFTIHARAAGNPTKDQMRLMVQSLLADRFKLAIHSETKQVPALALTLIKPEKLGPKLIPHAQGPPCDPSATLQAPGANSSHAFPQICDAQMAHPAPNHMIEVGSRNTTMAIMAASFPLWVVSIVQ